MALTIAIASIPYDIDTVDGISIGDEVTVYLDMNNGSGVVYEFQVIVENESSIHVSTSDIDITDGDWKVYGWSSDPEGNGNISDNTYGLYIKTEDIVNGAATYYALWGSGNGTIDNPYKGWIINTNDIILFFDRNPYWEVGTKIYTYYGTFFSLSSGEIPGLTFGNQEAIGEFTEVGDYETTWVSLLGNTEEYVVHVLPKQLSFESNPHDGTITYTGT